MTRNDLSAAQLKRKRAVGVARAAAQPGESHYSDSDIEEITQKTAAVSAAAAVAALRASQHESEPPATSPWTKRIKAATGAVVALGALATVIGEMFASCHK